MSARPTLAVRVRLLPDPCCWCWEIIDERNDALVESSWATDWVAYETREEALSAGSTRLAELQSPGAGCASPRADRIHRSRGRSHTVNRRRRGSGINHQCGRRCLTGGTKMRSRWIVIAATAATMAFAPVIVGAQMRGGMGPMPGGMGMGDMTQMQGMMQQMQGMMQQMGGMMQGGAMSPEQQKRMGELLQQMGGMMGMMHGMMGGMGPREGTGPGTGRGGPSGMGPRGDLHQQMAEMMRHMAEMQKYMSDMMGAPPTGGAQEKK